MSKCLRLGVNVDHVATIRNARGGYHPDPLHAAQLAMNAGADGITAHLREDRRHISDDDITKLSAENNLPLNLEIAATKEMLGIALQHTPHAACIVPEKREERTTEGGLDVVAGFTHLAEFVRKLSSKGTRVSVFIEPETEQIDAAKALGALVVELHTGAYCHMKDEDRSRELEQIKFAAEYASKIGLECHAGHGLGFETVVPIAEIKEIVELNIGHFLIGEAIFGGLESAVMHMRSLMNTARKITR